MKRITRPMTALFPQRPVSRIFSRASVFSARQSAISAALALSLFATGALSGCSVGPDYTRPKTSVPETFKEPAIAEGTGDWKLAAPGDVDQTPWWEAFGDATLNAMMPQLAAANPDIRTAEANLRQAAATSREALSAFFPSIDAGGDIGRGQNRGHGPITNSYRAQLQASWEIDLFGGVRRGMESVQATEEAKKADLAAAILLLRAELAQNYFHLRALDEQLELYRQTVAAYEKSLAITSNQHAAGVALRIDVAQAETQLKSTKAQAIDLELERRQAEHAIAVLLGMPPAAFSIAPGALSAKLPRIESVMPSALLERRPDIAAAERRMAAANAQIGVAKSAYFPRFSLSGAAGYSASAFAEWFTLPARLWSLGSSAAMNLFQGGRQLAKTDQAVAAWEASTETYRKTVLSAFREIEDQLAAMTLLEQEETMRLKALESSREAERLAVNQYRAGVSSYLTVVTTQASALANARSAVVLKGRRFLAAVAMIRALGGGWSTPEAEKAAKQAGEGTNP